MLSFEDIPIGARVLRAVELLSALAADRPYRAALNSDGTVEALKSSAGIECDPYSANPARRPLKRPRLKKRSRWARSPLRWHPFRPNPFPNLPGPSGALRPVSRLLSSSFKPSYRA
jgi:hypothetical protein